MRFGDRKPQIPNDFHNRCRKVVTLYRAYLRCLHPSRMIWALDIADLRITPVEMFGLLSIFGIHQPWFPSSSVVRLKARPLDAISLGKSVSR